MHHLSKCSLTWHSEDTLNFLSRNSVTDMPKIKRKIFHSETSLGIPNGTGLGENGVLALILHFQVIM